ncbi:MAG: tRNA (adenosine(37)-N6)-threonylcarbamoyltransferase complex dimerization subunit type 1 TsaB [Candidatus Dadabacteria bacterium]
MKLLGIETSTHAGSIAFMNNNGVLGELFLNLGPVYSERIIPAIDWLMGEIGIGKKEIKGIAVSIGPGSFTGLRVGLSTAKGLAFSLGIPLVGVSSLEALAMNIFTNFPICSIIDAKKKEVFAAFFRFSEGNIVRTSSDILISPQELCKIIRERTVFIGDGALLYRDLFMSVLGEIALFCPLTLNFPRASNSALIGARKLRGGQRDDPSTLAPQYLRKPEAEIYREV